jgi:energy-coupling factor transport system substrate-specific component
MQKFLNAAILVVASLIGLGSFFYPFFVPQQDTASQAMAHSQDAPLIFVLLVVLCLGAVLSSLSAGMMNTKLIAVLGVLTAANAVLRGIPGPAGFTLVFLLPILCGYVYGPTFGFLLGVFSLAVSAFLGFGVGPWLPYQMLSAGWVGLLSGWLPRLGRQPRAEVAMLAGWGLLLGFAFGLLMNVYFWPYVFTPTLSDMYWQPGLGLFETLKRYALFYAVTSLWWDLARAIGNLLLLLLFAAPVLRLLRRFQQRFYFTVSKWPAPPAGRDRPAGGGWSRCAAAARPGSPVQSSASGSRMRAIGELFSARWAFTAAVPLSRSRERGRG